MELVYVALLLHKAGKEINEVNVKRVADAAGINANDQQIKALVNALDGVDIEKEIKEAAVVAVPVAESKKEVEVKEEKKDEKKTEEAAAQGLASLFG